MNNYEAMFIVRPDLSEEEQKDLFAQINDAVSKNKGKVASASVWSEKRKLLFPIQRYREGTYYLLNFSSAPEAITDIRHAYKLNENILRVMFTR